MKKFNNFNIVALGSWNRKIFYPQWIMKDVMELQESDRIEGVFNSEEMDVSYRIKGISIYPKENYLEISTLNDTNETQKTVLLTFLKIANLLPYTPLKGVGFNFVYTIDPTDIPFLEDQIKSQELLPNGLDIFKLAYKEKAPNFVLNVIVEKKDTGEWQVTFNFHHPMIDNIKDDYLNLLGEYVDKYFSK